MTPVVMVAWPDVSADAYVSEAQSLGAALILNAQGGGGQWLDESGNGLHGAESGGATWHAAGGPSVGIPGFYRLTSGTLSHLDFGDDPLLRFGEVTLAWWEQNGHSSASGDENNAVRIAKGDRAYQMRRPSLAPSWPSLRWTARNNDAASEASAAAYEVVTGAWQFFVGRISSTYVDIWDVTSGVAVLLDSVAYTGGLESNTDPFSIGAQHDRTAWRRWWSGDIAGVLAFPTALTTAQMEGLHAAAL